MAAKTTPGTGLDALVRDLQRGRTSPVYVVEGEESLLASQAVDAIVGTTLSAAAARDFNLNLFSGDDEAAREFLAQARSYPFLAERRVVVVRRFDKLGLKEREEAAFLEYLKRPAPTTVLVLVASKLDRRTSVAKALDRGARVVKVDTLDETALPAWVRERLSARGLRVSERAVHRLVELAGPKLLDLANEIEKLVARYGADSGINVEMVDATVGQHRVEEVWAINRAFLPGDPGGFLRGLARALETDKDGAIRLGAVLSRHVNDLLRAKILMDRGVSSPGELAGKLHRKFEVIEHEIAPQARVFTHRQLILWLRNLQRADVLMKSSSLPQRMTLERALLNSFLGQELA